MPRQDSQWNRETKWRQGHVLQPDAVAYFGLGISADNGSTRVVVITHDCDLANDDLDAEPHVEVIVGCVVPKANGNYTWGKAPRTLHYTVQRNGASEIIELVATKKSSILKEKLANFDPDLQLNIDVRNLAVLRNWLSVRYNRAAFADEFVNRMKSTKADEKIADVLKKKGESVSFTYFDVDGGKCIERESGDPYKLKVVLVFNPGDDPESAADKADDVAQTVETALRRRLPEDGQSIQLEACFAVSEEEITVSQARVLSHWRLEYMTHRADDEQLGPLPA